MTPSIDLELEENMAAFVRVVSGLILTVALLGIGVLSFGQRSVDDVDLERNIRTRLAVERMSQQINEHDRRLTILESRPAADIQLAKLAAEVESLKWWVQSGVYGAGGVAGATGLILAGRRRRRETEKKDDA